MLLSETVNLYDIACSLLSHISPTSAVMEIAYKGVSNDYVRAH